jgi:hypothetical protein
MIKETVTRNGHKLEYFKNEFGYKSTTKLKITEDRKILKIFKNGKKYYLPIEDMEIKVKIYSYLEYERDYENKLAFLRKPILYKKYNHHYFITIKLSEINKRIFLNILRGDWYISLSFYSTIDKMILIDGDFDIGEYFADNQKKYEKIQCYYCDGNELITFIEC